MTPAFARKLLMIATQSVAVQLPEATMSLVVQAVEVAFGHAVVYDRETGAVCPVCHNRARTIHTHRPDEGTQLRRHYCQHCQRAFCSSCREIPQDVAIVPARRHNRGRKRRA